MAAAIGYLFFGVTVVTVAFTTAGIVRLELDKARARARRRRAFARDRVARREHHARQRIAGGAR